jgi:hypothetical protein
MRTEQYRKIESHPLRQVLRNVCNDPRDLPSRSELRAAITEVCPAGTDQRVKDALFTKAQEFAKAAAADPGARFDLRGSADRLTLHVIETWENAERLLPADEDTEPVDVSAVIDGMDTPGERALRQITNAHKQAGLEANARWQSS